MTNIHTYQKHDGIKKVPAVRNVECEFFFFKMHTNRRVEEHYCELTLDSSYVVRFLEFFKT